MQNLSRRNTAIDRVHVSAEYNEFLGKPGPLRCTFPWSKEPVHVDRRFWESLVCLDPPKKGWLMDEVFVLFSCGFIEIINTSCYHLHLSYEMFFVVFYST